MHGPDVKSATGVRLDGDEITFGRPIRMRSFLVGRGDLLCYAAMDRHAVEQALQVGNYRLMVWGNGDKGIGAFRDGDRFHGSGGFGLSTPCNRSCTRGGQSDGKGNVTI